MIDITPIPKKGAVSLSLFFPLIRWSAHVDLCMRILLLTRLWFYTVELLILALEGQFTEQAVKSRFVQISLRLQHSLI